MEPEQERLLVSLLKKDPMYQELLKKCGELEPEYERIMNTLSEEDRDILDRYIGICEELEHQKVHLLRKLFSI